MGAPGLLVALLVKLTLREPRRGSFDSRVVSEAPPTLAVTVRRLVACPTFRHVCAGCTLTTLAASSINLFAPSYFVRRFGMSLSEVGLLYGAIVGVAGIAGLLAGGFGADVAARRDVRWHVWTPAVGVALAFPFYALAYSRSTAAPALTLVLLGALSVSLYLAPTFAIVQNLAEPRMRASASALVLLTMNVVGQGLGPLVMGLTSDIVASRAFVEGHYQSLCAGGGTTAALTTTCAAASATGLRQSILLTTLFFLWGAAHYARASRSNRARPAPGSG